MICFTAGERQYLDHLAPVWHALPAARRGRFWVPSGLAAHAAACGVEATVYEGSAPQWGPGGPIVVAATQDNRRARGARRPVVFMQHGAGQAYNRADGRPHHSYAGGAGRENVRLFLAVNEQNAARWRRGYPRTPVVVVGCPKLDRWPVECGPRPGPVCVSFHWRGRVCPEAGTAWDHYRRVLPELARHVELVGHCHPRIEGEVRPALEAMGIPYVGDFDEVLERCSVYACDNSSTLFEFAAAGGPVVVLTAPWWRRDVEHGLRFWESSDVGVRVGDPAHLVDAVAVARRDPAEFAARRRDVVRAVYPHRGLAAVRAAEAITELEG